MDGEEVEFCEEIDPQGRKKAVRVTGPGEFHSYFFSLEISIIIIFFFVCVCVCVCEGSRFHPSEHLTKNAP